MSIESEYLVHRKDQILRQKTRSISAGSTKSFDSMHATNRITATLDHLEQRGVIFLGGLEGVYAIKHYGEDDMEGEIQDLSAGYIEMNPGDEVSIVKHTKTHTKELIFIFERPSGNITDVPVSDVFLPSNLTS